MNNPQTIRWLIAHEPVKLFLRTAEAFSAKLDELTNGQYKVEIFTPTQYMSKLSDSGTMTTTSVQEFKWNNGPMQEIDSGNIEMSQLHISELGRYHNPDFFAFELPFLFRDHDHAASVFEGPIGKGLMSGLSDHSPARGLAFTYSGGFRCVASDTEISSIDELKGMKFTTGINPVTIDTITAIGAIPDPAPIADHAEKIAKGNDDADILETTIPRYLAQFQGTGHKSNLLNTKHSLFLTSIIISNKLWESLDVITQAAFQEASLYASRLERKWSVEDAVNFADTADEKFEGTYKELSIEETTKFKKLTAPLYNKYADFFTPNFIDGIIKS
jgi:TRAP-type C4-dicarboxylate transport system substrate-binding protein